MILLGKKQKQIIIYVSKDDEDLLIFLEKLRKLGYSKSRLMMHLLREYENKINKRKR